MKSRIKFFTIIGSLLLFVGCGSSENQNSNSSASETTHVGQSGVKDDMSNPNVVQVAVGSPDHSTLVAALKAADYVDALANVGPFTVFAPTNSAFDALPEGTLATLTKAENQRQLRDILEYHVLLGVYKVDDFVNGRKLGTADGRSVEIQKNAEGTVLVNGAKILGSVQASNGIIHVVDKVLIPE
ncbi:Uncaracterized surface protein containing fasciclin (FAS1) repeats [Aquiflexum balticum DSM 16537]|uniref:Uncaracterized surface protein containing fasciclin (FAS1) repeats n=1 Tax=Aquiflexum balticum DSM 16537 TaxID=758820 RepID=A0A1W2HBF8_9BACT|nr:fasciclin domain-containing protein [Aquiflexum balticum]SMD46209.1 Uncaracterized surface protein containing fasciclin (FAS1) repeats [Aquiflexum balticum DSM 16537]